MASPWVLALVSASVEALGQVPRSGPHTDTQSD